MTLVELILFTCALLMLLVVSGMVVMAKVALSKLRFQLVDRSERERLSTKRRIKKVIRRAESIHWTASLIYVSSLIVLGICLVGWTDEVLELWDLSQVGEYVWMIRGSIYIIMVLLCYMISQAVPVGAMNRSTREDLSRLSRAMLIIDRFFYPITWMSRRICYKALKKLGISLDRRHEGMEIALQIRAMGYEDAALSPQLISIIRNAIKLPELDVSDVIVPRTQIQYLDIGEPVEMSMEKAKRFGHTRYPVCQGSLDNCLGFVHIKDLFQYQGALETLDLEKFMYQLVRFGEDTQLEDALNKLLKYKIHMSLVVDQFGGVIGLLTLENILEELVGTIQDEFDIEDSLISPIGKDVYQVSGLAPIHEVENALGVSINVTVVSTFGGLVTRELGRIPEKNERVFLYGLAIKVIEVSEKRVISMIVRPIRTDS